MKVYIAGRMRGLPHFNFPAFDSAAKILRDTGHDCFNPAENDRNTGFDGAGWSGHETLVQRNFDLRAALATDLAYITQMADAVCVLPGWELSLGARAEVATAHALGLPVAPVEAFHPDGLDHDLVIYAEAPVLPPEL